MLLNEETGEKDETVLPPDTATQETVAEGKEETSSPEAGAPAKDGVDTAAGKTYTQEEVTRMMHERTKDYASLKRESEAYRSFLAEQAEKAKRAPSAPAPQAPTAPELDEDDKKFLDYLKKVMPGIDRVGVLGKLDDSRMGFIETLQRREEAAQSKFVDTSEQDVFKFCDTINAKDDSQKAVVRDAVAAVILNDPNLSEKWNQRDPSVIADAIKVLESTLGKRTEVAAKQDLSAAKAKMEKVQQPMPKGGIPAPISKQKPLTEDERVNKAWDALNKKG